MSKRPPIVALPVPLDIRNFIDDAVHSSVAKAHAAKSSDGFGRCSDYAVVGARVLSLLTEHPYEAVVGGKILDCGEGRMANLSEHRKARRAVRCLSQLSRYHCWIESRHSAANGQVREEVIDFTVRHDALYAKALGVAFAGARTQSYLWTWSDELEPLPDAVRDHLERRGMKPLWMWREEKCTLLLRKYEKEMPAHFGSLTAAALRTVADRMESAFVGAPLLRQS